MFLLAFGCGGSSPAGSGSGGNGSPGSGGSTSSGNGGSTSSGNGGSTSSGSGGSTSSGNGGSTSAGTGGSTSAGTGGSTSAGTGGSTISGNAGTTGAAGTGSGGTTVGSTQCSDGKDNDGDGKIDYLDPECVGPGDNDESSFATGISGDNMDACKQDCFFDGNSGMGDDKCLWQLKCDPMNTNAQCPYDSAYAAQHADECSFSASQSQTCINACRKFVPNGCDCFGCCAIPGGLTIRLAPTCTAADFGDPVKCPRCTQVTQCSNPCGECEICIGKTTIPANCGGSDGGTPVPVCNDSDFNITCGPGGSVPADGCPSGLGCLTGCCQPRP
jgi:hypothetical protein